VANSRVTSAALEILTLLNVGTMAVPSPSFSGSQDVNGSGSMAVAPTFAGSGFTADDVSGSATMTLADPVIAATGGIVQSISGSGAIGIVTLFPGNRSSATYATVVDGRVIDIGYGPIPDSTTDTLYVDLTGYTAPVAGDYWSEVCQTFSETEPVVPPGDIVPPWTKPRNGTDGKDGVDGGDGGDGEVPLAFTMPVLIPFHTDGGTGLTITNIPAALTEVSARMRTAYDLTDVCAIRLQCDVRTAAAGELVLQYSTDSGSTWDPVSDPIDYDAEGPFVSIASTGDQRGTFLNPVDDAKTEVLLSIFARNGNGSSDPVVGNLSALCYTKTSSGACSIVEPTIEACDVLPTPTAGPSGEVFQDLFAHADNDAFRAYWIAANEYSSNVAALAGCSLYQCSSTSNSEFGGGAINRSGGWMLANIYLPDDTNETWGRVVEWFLTDTAAADVAQSSAYAFPVVAAGSMGFGVYRTSTGWTTVGFTVGTEHTHTAHTAATYIATQSHDIKLRYQMDATTAYVTVWDNGVVVYDVEGPFAYGGSTSSRVVSVSAQRPEGDVVTLVEFYTSADPYNLIP